MSVREISMHLSKKLIVLLTACLIFAILMQALNCISKSAQKLCSADCSAAFTRILLPVVGKVHNAIRRINHYPADSTACFVNTYAAFEQPGPVPQFNFTNSLALIRNSFSTRVKRQTLPVAMVERNAHFSVPTP